MADPVYHCLARWSPSFRDVMIAKREDGDAFHALRDRGQWSLVFATFDREGRRYSGEVKVGDEAVEPDGNSGEGTEPVVQWRMFKLGPTVWTLHRSIVLGRYHAYVVLYGVPDPAPWEG